MSPEDVQAVPNAFLHCKDDNSTSALR